MAFGDTDLLDGFDRGDGPLGSNWTEPYWAVGGWEVETNVASCEGGAENDCEYWNVETFGAVCEAYITWSKVWQGASGLSVITRIQTGDVGDSYVFQARAWGTDNARIYRLEDGSFNSLGDITTGFTWADGDKVGGESDGNSHTFYYNDGGAGWTNAGSQTDSTFPDAGYIGMLAYGHPSISTFSADDFGGGTIGEAVSNPSRLQRMRFHEGVR